MGSVTLYRTLPSDPNLLKKARVSNILSYCQRIEDKEFFKAWKENVGEEVAEKKKNEASVRGTKFHKLLELFAEDSVEAMKYMNNKLSKSERTRFKHLMKFTKRITPLLHEHSLFHKSSPNCPYEYRGTFDMLARANTHRLVDVYGNSVIENSNIILDWKITKNKPVQFMTRYFLQLAAYAYALSLTSEWKIYNAILVLNPPRCVKVFYLSPSKFERWIKEWVYCVEHYYKRWKYNWEELEYSLGYDSENRKLLKNNYYPIELKMI